MGMFTAEQEESITRANREIDMMEAQVDSWYDATKAQAKIDQVKALETDAKQKEADLRQQLESGAIDQKTFNEKLAEIKNNHKQAVDNMVAALRVDAINQAIIQLKKDGIPVYSEIF
jgi:ribosomal protein S3